MNASDISVTGFTTIPFGDRVARPSRRKVRPSWRDRAADRRQLRQAWNARRAAEVAAAPTVVHPRDTFTLRHADAEIRRV